MTAQDLPPTFKEYQKKADLLGFIDIEAIPFNCLLEIGFHDKLIGMTVMPIAFIFLVGVLYVVQHVRLSRQAETDQAHEIRHLQAIFSKYHRHISPPCSYITTLLPLLPLSCLGSSFLP